MRKKAELMKSRDRLANIENLSSLYEALGEVSADTQLPAGSRPIFDKVVQIGGGRMKSFVVVYGVDSPKGVRAVSDSSSKEIGKTLEGGMIFNPNTGKFEKQE